MRKTAAGLAALLLLSACGGDDGGSVVTPTPTPSPTPTPTPTPTSYVATKVGDGTYAALVFLPDGRALYGTRSGTLLTAPAATPAAATALQGAVPALQIAGAGLIDIVVDPDFQSNQTVYVSTMEGTTGQSANLAIYRVRISATAVTEATPIWRSPARPADTTLRRIGGYLAIRDGFVHMAVGDFGVPEFAQDSVTPFGKIVRIQKDGTPAPGNPLYGQPLVNNDIYTLGHRDPQGLTLGSDGQLYETELGPRVGDEVNVVEFNRNYGWPIVSEGLRDDGTPYPRHSARTEFRAPIFSWSTVTGPNRIVQVRSDRDGLKGQLVISSRDRQGFLRLSLANGTASELATVDAGSPTLSVAEASDGRVYGTTYDVAAGAVYRIDRR